MADTSRKSSRRTRRWNALLALFLALLLAALIGYHFVNLPPDFYRSATERDRARLLVDADSFCKRITDFISDVWSERATPIEVSDNEINGYLAAVNDPEIWDRLALQFEPWRKTFTSTWLRNVQVDFREGQVTVAGEVTWHDMDLVVSVSGRPETDADGLARLHVTSVHAGQLRLPKFLFRSFLKDIDDRPVPAKVSHWRLKRVEIHDGHAVLFGETTK